MSLHDQLSPEIYSNKKFSKNSGFINLLRKINSIPKIVSRNVFIPRIIVDLLRTEQEVINRKNDENLSKNFDNIETIFPIIRDRIQEIKNIISDMEMEIDRNSNKIEELDDAKNNKILFSAYSENYTIENVSDELLKHTLNISNHVEGLIADEDSGVQFNNYTIGDKSYIKVNIDDSKLDGITFVSDSSVKIVWNETLKAYEIEQNDIFRYDSSEPEDTIIINHNLSTRALDIKIFKLDPTDIDLKYPIVPGIEYPSDNQIKIYLTSKQLISVLIARI